LTTINVFFAVNNTGDAAFAITLEPAGGSLNPTMEQLYKESVIYYKNILLLKKAFTESFFFALYR
jgi:hypothetical protein